MRFLLLFPLKLNCAKSTQLSPRAHVIRSACAVGFKCISQKHFFENEKGKTRLFLPLSLSLSSLALPPSLSAKKRGRQEEEERRKKRQSVPLSLRLSFRRRFLVWYSQKAVLSRLSGDPVGRTWQKTGEKFRREERGKKEITTALKNSKKEEGGNETQHFASPRARKPCPHGLCVVCVRE